MVRAVRIHEMYKVRRERRSGFQTFTNIYTVPLNSSEKERSARLWELWNPAELVFWLQWKHWMQGGR
jgi:hypothetical protein